MSNCQKLPDVSVLRSFAIISVVLYHAFCPYMGWFFIETPLRPFYNTIFSNFWGFRMPLFIFISGYLFSYLLNKKSKYTSVFGFIKKKFTRLVIPYIIFSALIALTYKQFNLNNLENFENGYEHLWFILMLFWCFVVARLLACITYINRHTWLQFVLLIIFLNISLICKLNDYKIDRFLSFDCLVNYFVWFWFGYILLLNKEKLLHLLSYKYIILFTAIWIIACCQTELFCPKDNSIWGYKIGYWYDFIKYLSYFSIIFSIFLLINIKIAQGFLAPQWVESLNKCSYGIYIFHHWIMRYIFTEEFTYHTQIYDLASRHHLRFPFIMFVCVFILSFLITKLLLKLKVGRFFIG
jgi:peptidoglycan/LPS O-acetylase OafA/YrhL